MRGLGTAFQDVGSFFGMVTFTLVASFVSRRLAFLGALLLSMVVTMFVFTSLHIGERRLLDAADDGLRAARGVRGLLDLLPGAVSDAAARHRRRLLLQHRALSRRAGADPVRLLSATLMSFRTAAVLMSTVYLVGMVALIWAPETKGKPLPED